MPFLDVLIDPILPVFAILAFGFGLGRAGRVTVETARTVNSFAMTILIPIVLFGLLAEAPFEAFDLRPALTYAAVQVAIFTFGYQLARRLFGAAPGESVILAYAGIFTNNVFYGLPLAMLIYGPDAVLPITTIVVIDSTLSFGGTMIALQALALGRVSPRALGAIFTRTPALQAMLAGLVVGLAGITLPGPVKTFLDFNGSAAAPVALFALGVVMSETRFSADPAVAAFSAIKLALFPAALWAGLALVAPDTPGQGLFVFGSAGPTGAMAFSLALLHKQPTARVAQVMVWTSILSLFSLAALA